MRINPNNYINIQQWMVSDLNLSGNELLIFALIYGYSQDGQGEFFGGFSYIAEWINCSTRTVINIIKELENKKYIKKRQEGRQGQLKNYYRALNIYEIQSHPQDNENFTREKNSQAICNNFIGDMKKIQVGSEKNSVDYNDSILYDNIEQKNNKYDNKEYKDKIRRKIHAKSELADAVDKYTEDKEIRELLYQWLENRQSAHATPTVHAVSQNLKKLESYAQKSGLSVKDYLEEVIRRGWQAFYEIKNIQNKTYDNGSISQADSSHSGLDPSIEQELRAYLSEERPIDDIPYFDLSKQKPDVPRTKEELDEFFSGITPDDEWLDEDGSENPFV